MKALEEKNHTGKKSNYDKHFTQSTIFISTRGFFSDKFP